MLASPVDHIDPWRLAAQGRTLAGRLALGSLSRLAPSLTDPGEVEYRLAFHLDGEHRAMVSGDVTAELVVLCQRCLEPLRIAVASHFEVAFVRGLDEAARLPEPYEPALAENGWVRPADLVEDELLLALPPIPRHAVGQCGTVAQPPSPDVRADVARPQSPFAVLFALQEPGKTEQ